MPINYIYPTTHFIKAYKALPAEIKLHAKQKEKIFRDNPFDLRLKTHKLKGKLKDHWAYSIDYQYRILFRFIDNGTVFYYDIGAHDIYK